MVFSRMAETWVLKQLTDADKTTSDGKLFHNVTVAGKKLLLHLLAELGRRTWCYDHEFHEYSIVGLGAVVLRLNHVLFEFCTSMYYSVQHSGSRAESAFFQGVPT